MTHETLAEAARTILREAYGPDAELRPGQLEAIEALLQPGARRLLVQSTGWGKSVVYFIAARLLRDAGRGATIVISPLIALMRNQVEVASHFGLRAEAIHSENPDSWPEIEARAVRQEVDVLFVSPERLHVPEFQRRILKEWKQRLALAVIDEAHCISEWGHDFRPEYRTVLRQLEGIPRNAAILGATATATRRVEEDLKRMFGPYLEVQRGPLVRPSLRLVAVPLASPAERLAWLAYYLPRMPGSGIVYALTVFDVKEVARWLRKQGINAEPYYAELESARRVELEAAFSGNRIKALVATTALGMGYDKADVGFVVHYQMPASLITYYQQIGRAGRATDRAFAVLLGGGDEDEEVLESFVNSARPPNAVFEAIVRVLDRGRLGFGELVHEVAAAPSQVRHALDILDSADALVRSEGQYGVVPERAREELLHGEEIRTLRRDEFRRMRAYLESPQCRMQAVAEALGDELAEPCGVCDRCRPVSPPHLEPARIEEARAFLEGEPKVLIPRRQLPVAIPGRKSRLAASEVCAPGIVLGVYGDGHWGQRVRDGKYRDGRYSAELIEAAARAVEESGTEPNWITWIPSGRPTSPLPGFAEQLEKRLGIPARPAVRRVRPGPPQKSMSAPHEQFLNVWDAFAVDGRTSGVCLLLDDIVDSGWTLTVVGLRLREAGCSEVVPLALAAASTVRVRFRDEGTDG